MLEQRTLVGGECFAWGEWRSTIRTVIARRLYCSALS
ncbi:hypothetical protein MPTK1_5g16125 [Marchantia polymorpha subsp. ruderalis]